MTMAKTQTEINHLLNFIANTNCQYERNDTLHNGQAALEHINKKYKYFKDDIQTAEDFIRYSATKSTLSGKYYQVHCNGQAAIKSETWLLEELKKFRAIENKSIQTSVLKPSVDNF